MLNATIIGKYFLSKNADLTDIQIQKLTYYAYAWYMVKHSGNKLFEERPQAWIHGPVFRSLYNAMKNMDFYEEKFSIDSIDQDIRDFLDIIYKIYGQYSGNELENMTHSESPWKNARIGKKPYERSEEFISDEDIMKCYG